jgi:hypothetical protein
MLEKIKTFIKIKIIWAISINIVVKDVNTRFIWNLKQKRIIFYSILILDMEYK